MKARQAVVKIWVAAIYGIGADLQAQGIYNERHDLGTALEESQVQVHRVADESGDKISPGVRFEPLENFSAACTPTSQRRQKPRSRPASNRAEVERYRYRKEKFRLESTGSKSLWRPTAQRPNQR